jgi:4-hydroxybenzoate polyprenyltransferase
MTFKGKIATAVDIIGLERVKLILAVQVCLALVLGIHLAVILNSIWIALLVGFGILFGLGYSVEPFHFKVRGAWHAIALASSAFFIPFMFMYLVVAEVVQFLDVMLIFALTIAHYSMEMANQAADHFEDAREGVQTPTVRLGLENALKSSLIMTTVGMILIIITVWLIFITSGISSTLGLAGPGGSIPLPSLLFVFLLISVIIGIGYYFPIKGLKDLYGYSVSPFSIEERIYRIKSRVKYASWQASGILGVVLTLGILFGSSFTGPVTMSNPPITQDIVESELDINMVQIANVKTTTWNEETPNNYAEVTVRLSLTTIENVDELTDVYAYVEAGTAADHIIDYSSNVFEVNGRTTVHLDLNGRNETEIWYFIYLKYKGDIGTYTWTEPSINNLYIFDADIVTREKNLLYDEVDMTVKVYNSGPAREEDSITLKIEWTPVYNEWATNNITVNPDSVWEITVDRDILKETIVDSSPIMVYLYYNDNVFDMMELEI